MRKMWSSLLSPRSGLQKIDNEVDVFGWLLVNENQSKQDRIGLITSLSYASFSFFIVLMIFIRLAIHLLNTTFFFLF